MRAGRMVTGLVGVGLALFGVQGLLRDQRIADPIDVARWLAGAVVVHDGILVPLVLATGFLLSLLVPPWARGIVRAGLLVAGVATLVVLPELLKPVPAANATVTPLPYGRNWLLVVAATALVTVTLVAARSVRRRRTERGVRPHHSPGP